jgi:lysophospholipase L1-like esterase
MGGSITEMNGFRPLVCDLLEKRFPQTDFQFINAGIASTDSTTGAFRLKSDILNQGPIDLLFVEFAVNDDQDSHLTRQECIRSMEGIIRHARRAQPTMDIVLLYFVNPGMLQTLQQGQTPLTIDAHEQVARHYRIPSVNVAAELAARIDQNTMTWDEYGGTHPGPAGNELCAELIRHLLDHAWQNQQAIEDRKVMHPTPDKPLNAFSYSHGGFLNPRQASTDANWQYQVPDWNPLPGQKRERFKKIPLLYATEPGSQFTLNFEGSGVGAYILAGPDAGIANVSIDDGPFKTVDLYHHFSQNLHYPRTVMFASELEPGSHQLRLRISKQTQSEGHAVRILQFTVNGANPPNRLQERVP